MQSGLQFYTVVLLGFWSALGLNSDLFNLQTILITDWDNFCELYDVPSHSNT